MIHEQPSARQNFLVGNATERAAQLAHRCANATLHGETWQALGDTLSAPETMAQASERIDQLRKNKGVA